MRPLTRHSPFAARTCMLFLWVVCVLGGEKPFAQNFTTVSATNVQNAFGQKLAAGQVCFEATNNNGAPISFKAGGGGQVIRRPVCAAVSAGAFSVSVPDTSLTTPANVCYRVTVKDSSTNQIVLGARVNGQPSGYDCVQPAGGSFNFDTYTPNLAPLALVIAGPPGPAGPAMIDVGTTTTGNPGTSASVTNGGTNTAAVLNFTIPRGNPGSPGVGVPAGGSGGQVLAKRTATDYDTQWVNQTGGGGSGVAAKTCNGTDKFSAVDGSGNFTCTADQTGAGGVTSWGSITGTLSNQTDLQNALGAKLSAVPVPGPAALGGVYSHDCGTGNAVKAVNTDGTVTCASAGGVSMPGGTNGQLLWNNGGALAGALGSSVDTGGNVTIGGNFTVNGNFNLPTTNLSVANLSIGNTAGQGKKTLVTVFHDTNPISSSPDAGEIVIAVSADGDNFKPLGPPIPDFAIWREPAAPTDGTRAIDPSMLPALVNGQYYIVYDANADTSKPTSGSAIIASKDLYHWSLAGRQVAWGGPGFNDALYGVEWYIDPVSGDQETAAPNATCSNVYLIAGTYWGSDNARTLAYRQALDCTMTNWTTSTGVTWVAGEDPGKVIDAIIWKKADVYNLFWSNAGQLRKATATNLTGPYHVVGNVSSFTTSSEAYTIVCMDGTDTCAKWRLYFHQLVGTPNQSYVETTDFFTTVGPVTLVGGSLELAPYHGGVYAFTDYLTRSIAGTEATATRLPVNTRRGIATCNGLPTGFCFGIEHWSDTANDYGSSDSNIRLFVPNGTTHDIRFGYYSAPSTFVNTWRFNPGAAVSYARRTSSAPAPASGETAWWFRSTDGALCYQAHGAPSATCNGANIGSQPACSSSIRGVTWIVLGGAGVSDTVQVCLKNSSDAYAWVVK